jgi:hypothetical protein
MYGIDEIYAVYNSQKIIIHNKNQSAKCSNRGIKKYSIRREIARCPRLRSNNRCLMPLNHRNPKNSKQIARTNTDSGADGTL